MTTTIEQELIKSSSLIFQAILQIKQGNSAQSQGLMQKILTNLKQLDSLNNDSEPTDIKWNELGCIESGINLDLMLRDQLAALVQKHQKLLGKKHLLNLYREELLKD